MADVTRSYVIECSIQGNGQAQAQSLSQALQGLHGGATTESIRRRFPGLQGEAVEPGTPKEKQFGMGRDIQDVVNAVAPYVTQKGGLPFGDPEESMGLFRKMEGHLAAIAGGNQGAAPRNIKAQDPVVPRRH